MIESDTMRSIKLLSVAVLLAVYIQNMDCKHVDNEVKPVDNILAVTSNALATRERDLRGLRDVLDQVKNSVMSSWNFIKQVTKRTKDKIIQWTESAREYGKQLEKSFEVHLKSLRERLNNIITDLLGTGKIVKQCLKDEDKNIDSALKKLLENMAICVANQIKQLAHIKGRQDHISLNDTLFITELDKKLNACESDTKNYENCLYTAREQVYDDIEDMDNHIQKTHMESRSLADDIMNTLASCSLMNLAEVSSFVTSEMMEVVKCVLDSKGINEAILE